MFDISSAHETRTRVDEAAWLVRAEFLEMPGMWLTVEQASCLFGLDPGLCERVLLDLCRQGFLRTAHDGRYGRTGG